MVELVKEAIVRGAEASQGEELEGVIQHVVLNTLPDKWVWDLSTDGGFSVASTRRFLDDSLLEGTATATRWVRLVPIKVNVFAWKMMWDALPTRWKLSQRGMDLDSILCPICASKVEDRDHVFFSCSFAEAVMQNVVSWWGVQLQPLASFTDWRSWFDTIHLRRDVKEVFEGVCFVTWWSIWRYRN